jgi:nucleoside-triphosphatase
MNSKILITGPPRCGKTTLITKLINYFYNKNFQIFGFLTPEVQEKGKRIGFDIENIYSGQRKILARIGDYQTSFKLGKYCVFVDNLDNLISDLEKLDYKKINLLIIDEIGKMELFSEKFQKFVKVSFQSDSQIIATIGEKLRHPIKDYLLQKTNIIIYNLTQDNFNKFFHEITRLIK